MLSRFRSAVNSAVGNIVGDIPGDLASGDPDEGKAGGGKYGYNRPPFLQLNEDEVQVSADHMSRPILVPRDISRLPWSAGYAEVINAGKTKVNEDQARAETLTIPGRGHVIPAPFTNGAASDEESNGSPTEGAAKGPSSDTANYELLLREPLRMTYFSLFDGHAGPGAAIMAVNCLHQHIQLEFNKLRQILLAKHYNLNNRLTQGRPSPLSEQYRSAIDKTAGITKDMLITGALEQAFQNMDFQIEEERSVYQILGGCCALAAIFFLGKLYVANAGDSRAVLCRGEEIIPLSTDFSPEHERQRIQFMGYLHPELLHSEFTHLEFPRRLNRQDLGKQMLFRDALMTGWAYKTVTDEDLRFPLIYGQGKKARVLATIGVTRGFGDHDLRVHDSDIYIKPFLSSVPEVQVYDLSRYEHTENDFLIMATDGLWDVTSNEKAVSIVKDSLMQFDREDKSRYTSAAQELVMYARGLLKKGWRMSDNRPASGDDITCFVIPLHCYHSEPVPPNRLDSAEEALPSPKLENESLHISPMDTTEDAIESSSNIQAEEILAVPPDKFETGEVHTATSSELDDDNVMLDPQTLEKSDINLNHQENKQLANDGPLES